MQKNDLIDSKKFYFGKAHDYSKYRPDYPIALFELLRDEYNINNDSIVCELGAGTGKFSKLMSDFVSLVYSVEPNSDMMKQGIKYCNGKNVKYVAGSAEETTLEDCSVDIVFAVQSFHWFNKESCKNEVKRILKNDGLFAIVWNDWEDPDNEFSHVYFKYVKDWKNRITGSGYQHKNEDDRKNFFRDQKYNTHTVIHSRKYSLEELVGLSKSLSYAPKEDDELYDEFINGVIEIFDKYKIDNYVTFDFHTEMFIGKV